MLKMSAGAADTVSDPVRCVPLYAERGIQLGDKRRGEHVACEKIERFARSEGVNVTIRNEPLETAQLPAGCYDIVLMNGCLHYVRDKTGVLRRAATASTDDAVHAVALFSTATPVPAEHAVVPVFPDDEGGTVERFYQGWRPLYRAYERGQSEHSHPGFAPHVHSHIKLVHARTFVGGGSS